MILLTMIGRVKDGLLLTASIPDDKDSKSLLQYQNKGKLIFKEFSNSAPASRGSIDTQSSYFFHYTIENGVCYMILTEANFSKRLSFAYLEDIQTEFWSQYGSRVETASRPYGFIEFDTYLQKAKKNYTDSRALRNLGQLNVELQDVQRIMVQNIDDILQRGESLSTLDDRAQSLSSMSKKYRQDATQLNLRSAYAKYVIVCIILFIVFTYVYFKFFW